MARKSKHTGDVRRRLIQGDQPPQGNGDAKAEYTKLASELAGSVGKTVEKATDLGLEVVQDIGLKVMEVLSTAKPSSGTAHFGAAAALFTRTRDKAPEFSGQVASKLTGLVVNGGFEMLRVIQQTLRNTRRPG